MARYPLLMAPFLMGIAGCDAATEIAGDTMQGEMRGIVVAQCEQVAEGAGIAAGRISAVCQCGADKLVATGTPTLADATPDRLHEIIQSCVAETDPDGIGQ